MCMGQTTFQKQAKIQALNNLRGSGKDGGLKSREVFEQRISGNIPCSSTFHHFKECRKVTSVTTTCLSTAPHSIQPITDTDDHFVSVKRIFVVYAND